MSARHYILTRPERALVIEALRDLAETRIHEALKHGAAAKATALRQDANAINTLARRLRASNASIAIGPRPTSPPLCRYHP